MKKLSGVFCFEKYEDEKEKLNCRQHKQPSNFTVSLFSFKEFDNFNNLHVVTKQIQEFSDTMVPTVRSMQVH